MFAPRFIEHRGRRVLRLDFTGLSLVDLASAFSEARRAMAAEPVGSLRILTTLRSPLTRESAVALKQYGLSNRSLGIRATAVVGDSFWKVIVTDLQVHGRGDLTLFDDDATALDWLAQQ